MTEIKIHRPKPGDFALAVRDAVQLEKAVPFVVSGLVLAILVNVLVGAIATVGYAYVHALWSRMYGDRVE